MINVQKNLACLNPLFCNRVVGIKRMQYRTAVSLEGKQITILFFAGIKNDRPFKLYGFFVSSANAWWQKWKLITFATRTAVLRVVLGAIRKGAGYSEIPHVEGEPPVVTF